MKQKLTQNAEVEKSRQRGQPLRAHLSKREQNTENHNSPINEHVNRDAHDEAETGNHATPSMSHSKYALIQNLTALYGEGGASYLAARLMSIAMGELMSAPANTQHKPNLLSANDRMLICYGDSIRDEPASPLSALQRFATTHLAKAYRLSMSCRSFPLLRMTALRSLTIKR